MISVHQLRTWIRIRVEQFTRVEMSFEVIISIAKRHLGLMSDFYLYNHCTCNSVNVAVHYTDFEAIVTRGTL
jgi:hypothetical protein